MLFDEILGTPNTLAGEVVIYTLGSILLLVVITEVFDWLYYIGDLYRKA
jgi:hypothetical protein